jgi:dolichyl-phosphate-mannose-protein mannosyltransferase
VIEPGFVFKFFEAHRRMFYVNKRIGGKHDPSGPQSHAPRQWPTNQVTQKFCPNEPRTTLLGNPILWSLNLCLLAIFPIIVIRKLYINQREETMSNSSLEKSLHLSAGCSLFCAWALHYLPFFFMYRTLYIHHYYPAFYFSSLLSAILLDLTIKNFISQIPHQIKPLFQMSILVGIFSVMSYSYIYFSPIVYGMAGGMENQAKFDNSSYHYLHWVESWDL